MADNPRMFALDDALQALTYREMKDLADCMSEALEAHNGLKVKPEVFAEVLDSLGEFIAIGREQADA